MQIQGNLRSLALRFAVQFAMLIAGVLTVPVRDWWYLAAVLVAADTLIWALLKLAGVPTAVYVTRRR